MSFLDDARTSVRRWLSLLGITDRVVVELGRFETNVFAKTWANPDYLEARIVFNDPAVCGPYDLEEVAAHEVFHLPMADFKTLPDTPERSAEERAVERFSRAFVALWRGTPVFRRATLAPTIRAILGASTRERRAIAAGRSSMPEGLMALLMDAGAASGRDDVPDDIKELLRKLAAAAVTGDAAAAEPAESADEAQVVAAEATPGDQDPAAPAAREEMSPACRRSLAKADEHAAEAEAVARKRLEHEKSACRIAIFNAAPDVFGAFPKLREVYANAPIDEIERYVAAERAKRGERSGQQQGQGGNPKNREAFREPPPNGANSGPAKNLGGFTVKGN